MEAAALHSDALCVRAEMCASQAAEYINGTALKESTCRYAYLPACIFICPAFLAGVCS